MLGTIGSLVADSSTSTGLKWQAAAGGGKVLQVVQDTSTVQESTTSGSYVDTNLSISITPSAATSKILCIFAGASRTVKDGAPEALSYFNLVRTSTQIAETNLGLYVNNNNDKHNQSVSSIVYLDSPNTTSATTYKVQMRSVSASPTATILSIEGHLASLTLIEIGA